MQKDRKEIENFVEAQKAQLGLTESEAQDLLRKSFAEMDDDEVVLEMDDVGDSEEWSDDANIGGVSPDMPPEGPYAPKSASPLPFRRASRKKSGTYLIESRTIQARPARVSRFRSLLFEYALPNEFIVPIGVKDAKPALGGKFFKTGKKFLKFPATVQTVYFTSDNANKSYQGLRIDGYACWRVDPEKPDVAARILDFSDQENPMGNTNRILRTICTEAIRHIIANLTIDEALTKKDEIGRNLKSQLERIERTWGVIFDQVGIERVTILSSRVFEDLQQKMRDSLRLAAAESRMETDQEIAKKKAKHTEEMSALRSKTEKEARILKARTESEIHEVELRERSERDTADRQAEEDRRKAEHEAQERAAAAEAERRKRQVVREAEVEALKSEEERKVRLAQARAESEMEKETALMAAQLAETEHETELKKQRFALERRREEMAEENRLKTENQVAELQRESEKFKAEMEEARQNVEIEHMRETQRLKRMQIEEELRNQISRNRVMSEFVERLPEVAEAVSIDKYTVFSGDGASPLGTTIAQLLAIIEDRGIGFFSDDDDGKTRETAR